RGAPSSAPSGIVQPRPGVPPTFDGEEIIPLTGVRKIIADRLSLSRHTAADVTTVAEVDMTEITAIRAQTDFSYTAFVAAATVMALEEFPILNSRLMEDKIIISKAVHLGVAVAIDEGLKVPVIRDAHTKGLRQIGAELEELAKRGVAGRLRPEELTGSTFTITNSGVFGSLLFTPIINPPESAILGMGKIVKTPVVREDQVVIRQMMYLCLSYDHRVVDGAPAVKFLQRVKLLLETPKNMLSS
ncbi:MAG TPA: dihydrolipoamide acetyltransferase family protein, partial [Candidatus Methylomirabilis sp.]|nr:dihydrolipoamide acetyltransferase family protein [Candidatus Methylomirabilis sp.]